MGAMLVTYGSRLLLAWKRVQVSYHGGKYSVHRLLALETYTRNASLLRVLLVCIGSPLPMAILVILQELIPLQDPTDGWRVNYGFWIRMTIVAFVVNLTNVGQAPYFIQGVSLSKVQVTIVAGCTSTIFSACALPIVAHFMFPVPFFVLVFGPMYYLVQIVVFRIVTGARIFNQMLSHRDQLMRYMAFVTIQFTLLFTYPAYEALFRVAQGTQYQLSVILLLPVIKVFAKNMVLRCTIYLEDMMPEAAIFTVDYFNAIYVATCMQSASSTAAITAMTIADLSQAAITIYGLHIKTRTIRAKMGLMATASRQNGNLLVSTAVVCRDPVKYDKQFCSSIRIRSSIPRQLSPEDEELLDKLENSANEMRTDMQRQHKGQDEALYARKIHPVASVVVNPLHLSRKKSSLWEALEALFTMECVVVTAYLEAVVPVLYSGYMLMMVHFPSAPYHAELAGVTRESVGATVLPVFVFGLLQISSFAVLAVVIKRNCGMRMVDHLAFVLETQMSLIQCKLMVWSMLTLCFRVTHFGVDFTFKFVSSGQS